MREGRGGGREGGGADGSCRTLRRSIARRLSASCLTPAARGAASNQRHERHGREAALTSQAGVTRIPRPRHRREVVSPTHVVNPAVSVSRLLHITHRSFMAGRSRRGRYLHHRVEYSNRFLGTHHTIMAIVLALSGTRLACPGRECVAPPTYPNEALQIGAWQDSYYCLPRGLMPLCRQITAKMRNT